MIARQSPPTGDRRDAGREAQAVDRDAEALAREIASLGQDEQSSVFRQSFWADRMMRWAMARSDFKTQLFRFVDAFPAMNGRQDVARHIDEYFGDHSATPWPLRAGISAADRVPLASGLEARIARRNIERMARQFIAGATPKEAVTVLGDLWDRGMAFTVDLLGEKTLIAAEADAYAERVTDLLTTMANRAMTWRHIPRLEMDDLGIVPRVNVSIKPTALAPHYAPLTARRGVDEAKDRLRPILRLANRLGGFVYLDMEHYAVKDLTLRLFREVLEEDEFTTQEAGIVIQAYLRDSWRDLAELVAWSGRRPTPITVRLVKGAYWDTETVEARAADWPVPTFEEKVETDANYERCVRLLHDHHGDVRAAFGSHNLRSLAYAISYARHKGIPDNGFEVQMLYGMAEPIQAAIGKLGLRLRVYTPVGELVPGMAYLVRRLLENTSNESFVRRRFAEGRALSRLLAPPRVDQLPNPDGQRPRTATDRSAPTAYEPEPVREWRQSRARATFGSAVTAVEHGLGTTVPARIGGEDVTTPETILSVDPSEPTRLVAAAASCTADDANRAVGHAAEAAPAWAATPVRDRAGVLFGAADWMRQRRDVIAATECFEAGKPWDQADGDVCEAIDFCEYYGRQMLRLDGLGNRVVQSPPGEENRLSYQGKGVVAVIAPWNFPLAIPTGMTVAALVAGNAVVLKPAEQTPLTARFLIDALVAAGAPPGTVQFLPGYGETAGAALVEHPEVAAIAFTGSKAVGLSINAQAAQVFPGQRQVKRVVAEMGGKNALIIDSDADPDQVVPAVASSAFGFAGQKCSAASRLIVHQRAYRSVVERLTAYAQELVVGHPREGEVQVGPLIDEEAHKRVAGWVDRAPVYGRVLLARDDVPDQGYFVGPTIVEVEDPKQALAQEEVFGPVLAVLRARDIEHALQLANDTDYALTGGVFSRSPGTIREVTRRLRAGNVYVNRAITGSVVGRQPFGGYGLSGVGAKAGGPDYLLQFLDPRVVTENTLRQGFAPD